MLWFVGTGIGGYRGLSFAALDVLKKCDTIYLERFTSHLSDSDLEALESLVGKEIKPVRRWFVEDGREILETARSSEVALVSYGDPLIATTHSELRTRASRNSVKTSVLHSASGITSTIGEIGLHIYKLGRIVTIMSERNSAVSAYNAIFDNLLAGNHTLVLTEYNSGGDGEPFFLGPNAVFEMLMQAEADQQYGVFSADTFAIVASRVGTSDQNIVSGKVESLRQSSFGPGPHSVIITGMLHFTESDSLLSLTRNLDLPTDNSKNIKRISSQMIERYAPRIMQAVRQIREIMNQKYDKGAQSNAKDGISEALDNAEYYVSDAKRFLLQARYELAVLSIGYAEGLVDALRFQEGIDAWPQS